MKGHIQEDRGKLLLLLVVVIVATILLVELGLSTDRPPMDLVMEGEIFKGIGRFWGNI